MPRFDAGDAPVCSNPNENGRPDHVAKKGQRRADNDQSNSADCVKEIKFAKKDRDHQHGLQRWNPPACLFDSDAADANLDDVPVLKSRWCWWRGGGLITPAFPEQIKREQWNNQAVIVLRIKPPLGFQLIDELEPK